MQRAPSPNFSYLAYHDARLVALGTQAEEHFAGDPTVTLFKLRQFGEVLAQRAAAKVGLFVSGDEAQQQLIDRLAERNVIGANQRSLFHDLRRVGNAAVHEEKGDHNEALHQLRMARELAVWFQRSFGNNKKFDPGPFVPPAAPKHGGASPSVLVWILARLLPTECSYIARRSISLRVDFAQRRRSPDRSFVRFARPWRTSVG